MVHVMEHATDLQEAALNLCRRYEERLLGANNAKQGHNVFELSKAS